MSGGHLWLHSRQKHRPSRETRTKMCDYSVGIARDSFKEGIKEGIKEGKKEGQSLLVQAIQLLREGKTEKEILKEGIDQQTIDLAQACK